VSTETSRARLAGSRTIARVRGQNPGVRYLVVGLGGVAIGFVVYNVIYWINPLEPRAATSWFFACMLGVLRQHALHRWLTFHDRPVGYASSLGMTYVAYALGIAGSTALNWWFSDVLGFHHLVAWLVAVGSSVALNYVMLERFAFPAAAVPVRLETREDPPRT